MPPRSHSSKLHRRTLHRAVNNGGLVVLGIMRTGCQLHIAAGRERHAAESVFEIVQLDRAGPSEQEIGLVGHGMDMGTAGMASVRRGGLVVDGQMRQANSAMRPFCMAASSAQQRRDIGRVMSGNIGRVGIAVVDQHTIARGERLALPDDAAIDADGPTVTTPQSATNHDRSS